MKINPHLFFIMKEGEIVAWDYHHHQQYCLDKEYVERLLAWSKGGIQEIIPIDQELKDAQLIIEAGDKEAHAGLEWGWDVISQIFHKGTSDMPHKDQTPDQWVDDYMAYCQEIISAIPKKEDYYHEAISLPEIKGELLKIPLLQDVLFKRKTCRSFYGTPMTFDQLSTLLYLSFGMIHKEWADLNGFQQVGYRKAYPSGGGLHGEEIYLIVLRVDPLKPGIYHYDSHHHHLRLIRQGFFEKELIQLLHNQWFMEGLAVGIFLTSQFHKYWWKYPHSRGYRGSLLDIGHASQTFLLTATALSLDTWLTGAFHDKGVRDLLQIDSVSEFPLLFVGSGYGSGDSLHPKMRERGLKDKESSGSPPEFTPDLIGGGDDMAEPNI